MAALHARTLVPLVDRRGWACASRLRAYWFPYLLITATLLGYSMGSPLMAMCCNSLLTGTSAGSGSVAICGGSSGVVTGAGLRLGILPRVRNSMAAAVSPVMLQAT